MDGEPRVEFIDEVACFAFFNLCHIKLPCFNTNMLGMNTMEGVVMLASTNRQDILDQVNSGGLVSTVQRYVSTTPTFIRNNSIYGRQTSFDLQWPPRFLPF